MLPSTHKKALSANSDEIMYSTPGDVGIYYDDNGQGDMKLPAQNGVNCDVNCGCLTREEVCQYPDAFLVSDQRLSPGRHPGGDTHFPGSHQWRWRGNPKAANC